MKLLKLIQILSNLDRVVSGARDGRPLRGCRGVCRVKILRRRLAIKAVWEGEHKLVAWRSLIDERAGCKVDGVAQPDVDIDVKIDHVGTAVLAKIIVENKEHSYCFLVGGADIVDLV